MSCKFADTPGAAQNELCYLPDKYAPSMVAATFRVFVGRSNTSIPSAQVGLQVDMMIRQRMVDVDPVVVDLFTELKKRFKDQSDVTQVSEYDYCSTYPRTCV
jgi:hypothetical protein